MKTVLFTISLLLAGPVLLAQPYFSLVEGIPFSAASDTHGAAWVDVNDDGWLDVCLANEPAPAFYRNDGTGSFTEDESSILRDSSGIAYSSIWGDYNNDGRLDAYLSNWGHHPETPQDNRLFRQLPEDFQFTLVAQNVSQDSNFTWSSSWVDYNQDGSLDLCVPSDVGPTPNFFYENAGPPGYVFLRRDSLPFVYAGASNPAAAWFDYDNDGDEDLLLATFDPGENNRLFRNLLAESGMASFEEITGDPIVANGGYTIGFSTGDINNDGYLDVFSATWEFSQKPKDRLYINNGDGTFAEIADSPLVSANRNTLGSAFGDFDNDGDLDLYLCDSFTGNNLLFENDGAGNFTQLSSPGQVGPIEIGGNAQNAAWGDYDNDGDLDLLATTALNFGNGLNYLFRNERGNQNNWINLHCTGTESNKAAIGAKIWIKATIGGEETWQLRHISGSPTGDRSQSSLRVHFGLGDADVVDSLIVEYPSGIRNVFTNILPNQHCRLTEGQATTCGLINRQQEVEQRGGTLRLYPNPADGGRVRAAYELEQPAQALQIEIFDSRGQLLQKLARQAAGRTKGEAAIEVAGLPAGVYRVNLRAGEVVLGDTLIIH